MRRILVLLPASIAAFCLASPARAASFDCGRAVAADEVTVCRTPARKATWAYSR